MDLAASGWQSRFRGATPSGIALPGVVPMGTRFGTFDDLMNETDESLRLIAGGFARSFLSFIPMQLK